MLGENDLDALLVATPPSTHLEVWQAARQRGLPVFMEKPFPLTHELELIDVADPAWGRLMVNFNRRFWPAYTDLGRHVADGSLGRIRCARFVLEVDAQSWSRVTNHRARPEEGGALEDLGSQIIDLVLTTFDGEPTEIRALRSAGEPLEERIDLSLRYENGTVIDCRLGYGNRNRESVTIEGENATLRLRDPNFLCWVERDSRLPGRLLRSAVDVAALGYRGVFRGQSMLRYSVKCSLGVFFAALSSSTALCPDIFDALRVARCLTTAENSLQSGSGWIPLEIGNP